MNAPGDGTGAEMLRERVWDPLVRVFHWSLAIAFAIAWFNHSDAFIHETAGKIALGLVIFRAYWGLTGPYSARFESFLRGPGDTARYLFSIVRGRPERHLGHNPAGAVMVALLLVSVAGTSITGILMTTTLLWGNAWVEWVHGQLADACVLLIGAHLAGVLLASLQHREALPIAMVTGTKLVEPGTPDCLGPPPRRVRPLIAGVLVVLISAVVWTGTEKLFNASLWRLPKIVGSMAVKTGCAGATISGPVVEIWPALQLRYDIITDGRVQSVHVPLNEALDKSNPRSLRDADMPVCE